MNVRESTLGIPGLPGEAGSPSDNSQTYYYVCH